MSDKKYICLVEDDPDNAELVMDYYDGDYEFVHYESGILAWEALSKENDKLAQIDIFLLDISMPGLDGIELLKKIKSLPAHMETPCVALTAHAMKEDEDRFLSLGFDKYFGKPIIDFEDLREMINQLIAK